MLACSKCQGIVLADDGYPACPHCFAMYSLEEMPTVLRIQTRGPRMPPGYLEHEIRQVQAPVRKKKRSSLGNVGSVARRRKRKRILERDGNACVYCGAAEDLTLDHIIPKARGGTSADRNLQTLCRPCNHAKDDSLP